VHAQSGQTQIKCMLKADKHK